MIYKTHIAFAVLPIAVLETVIDVVETPIEILAYCFIAIGALFPDLDEENSYIGRKLPLFPMLYQILGVTHRGITHQLIFVVGLILLFQYLFFTYSVSFVEKLIAYSFIYGYFMHLAGDMLTKGGINNFFFPISRKKGVLLPRFLRFKTDSIQEHLLLYFLYFIFFLLIIVRNIYL